MWKETGKKPPALDSKPELLECWEFPTYVWESLNGSRQLYQGGINRIPFSEFFIWCLAHGVVGTDCTELWRSMATIDTLRVLAARQVKPPEPQQSQT